MTRKKDFVTREEFEGYKHKHERQHYSLGENWTLIVAYALSIFAVLWIVFVMFNNPLSDKEMFCIQNETIGYYPHTLLGVTTAHLDGRNYITITRNGATIEIVNETTLALVTNKCLLYGWRDRT